MYMYVHVCKTDMANITLIDEYATYFTKRKMIFTLELNKVYLSFNILTRITNAPYGEFVRYYFFY